MAGVVQPILSKAEFITLFRPLVGYEDALADKLLMAVSQRIRRKFAEAGVPLDEDDDEVDLVIWEVVAAVLRPGEFAGYSSVTITTDDATEQRVLANALAQLDITDAQWKRLGIDVTASPRGCFPENDY